MTTRGRSDLVVASSALALATMLGSTSKVTSLAASAGVRLSLGSEAVALLQGFHLEAVDLVDDAIEFVLQIGSGLDVDAAGEHQVDSVVEVGPGFWQVATLVSDFAEGVGLLHLLDELLYARRRSCRLLLWRQCSRLMLCCGRGNGRARCFGRLRRK